MRRFSPRLLVDVLMGLALAALVSTGLLLAFRLPPGSGSLSMLGLTRHEWGDWHFYLALTFMGLLGFHLLLNAIWLSSALKAVLPRRDPERGKVAGWLALGLLAVVGGLILALPWGIPVEGGGKEGGGRRARPAIVGSMTVEEVAEAEGIELTKLMKALGLAPGTSATSRLGPLGRQYGFTMEWVRGTVGRLKGGR